METDKKERKIREVRDKVNKLDKEITTFNDKFIKVTKDFCNEEIGIYKFITEQELKNIDAILDILKLTTSLSLSIFIASLTTTYFSEKTDSIIIINVLSIFLLIIFIIERKRTLSKSKTTLLKVLQESNTVTRDYINFICNDINKKLKEQKNSIKDLQK